MCTRTGGEFASTKEEDSAVFTIRYQPVSPPLRICCRTFPFGPMYVVWLGVVLGFFSRAAWKFLLTFLRERVEPLSDLFLALTQRFASFFPTEHGGAHPVCHTGSSWSGERASL